MRGRRVLPRSAVAGLLILPLTELAIAGRESLRHNPYWLYFEQIITGNWSSDQSKGDMSDLVYVLGFVAAVIVNFGQLIAIFGVVTALIRRRTDMDLVNAFASHDLMVETTIVRNLLSDNLIPSARREEFMRRVHTSVLEAREDWFGPLLDEKFGPEEAARIRERMRETRITP